MDKTIASDNDGCELRSLLSSSNRKESISSEPQVEYTYYDIQPGDSLHGICLRYARSVNQVRRLNRLMTDQDFYGLKRLKLPVGKFGLLEDLLRQNDPRQQTDLLLFENNNPTHTRHKSSPGSALSVTTRRNQQAAYEPLISLHHSSDRLDELSRADTNSRIDDELEPTTSNLYNPTLKPPTVQHNPHSFSSLRDYPTNDISIAINSAEPNSRSIAGNASRQYKPPQTNHPDSKTIQQQPFIKSEIVPDPSQITIDDMLTDGDPVIKNIFEDVDYHVERVKADAADYDKRAADIVRGIDVSLDGQIPSRQTTRVSKIPELFFSGENFGLNVEKLLILICFVCLVIPLVYMHQAHIVV